MLLFINFVLFCDRLLKQNMSNHPVNQQIGENRLRSSKSSHHLQRETETPRKSFFMSPPQGDNRAFRMLTPPKPLLQTSTSTPNLRQQPKALEQSQVVLLPPIYGGDVLRYYVKYYLANPQIAMRPMKRLSQTGSITDLSYSKIMAATSQGEDHSEDMSIIQQLSSISINDPEKIENEDHKLIMIKQLKKQLERNQERSLSAQSLGNYQQSIYFLIKNLEIIEQISPQKESDKVNLYTKLGGLYWKLQMTNQALHFYSKTLLHLLQNPIQNNVQISNLYLNLGRIYEQREELQKTLFCYLKSIQIRKLYHTQPHTEISNALNNLGLLEWKLKHFKAALKHLTEALQINEVIYGHNHPEVARNYYNLALCLFDLGDIDQWLNCHFESLRIMKFLHLDTHPDYHFWLRWFKNKLKQLIASKGYTRDLIFKSIGMSTLLLNKDEEIEFLEEIKHSMEMFGP